MPLDPTQPFDLPPLPPPNLNFKHERFIDVLLQTRTELGELNGYSRSLPNPLLLLSPAVVRESVASSNIENINSTMKEVLFKSMEMLEKKRKHIRAKHKKIYSADLVEAPFASPIITPVSLGKKLDINYRTASRYLAAHAKGRVLHEQFIGRYHLFINKPLLDLLKK